jgi:hypothetical protein
MAAARWRPPPHPSPSTARWAQSVKLTAPRLSAARLNRENQIDCVHEALRDHRLESLGERWLKRWQRSAITNPHAGARSLRCLGRAATNVTPRPDPIPIQPDTGQRIIVFHVLNDPAPSRLCPARRDQIAAPHRRDGAALHIVGTTPWRRLFCDRRRHTARPACLRYPARSCRSPARVIRPVHIRSDEGLPRIARQRATPGSLGH